MRVSVGNVQRSVPIPVKAVTDTARRSARRLRLECPECSIVFVGERRMRRINREFLGHDYVTDVITFDHAEIIICPAAARRNARRYGNSLRRELLLYVVHGLLHLAGYDDRTPADILRMRKKEQELLAGAQAAA